MNNLPENDITNDKDIINESLLKEIKILKYKQKIKELKEEIRKLELDYQNYYKCPKCGSHKGKQWWKTLCFNCSNEDCKKRNGVDIPIMLKNKKKKETEHLL